MKTASEILKEHINYYTISFLLDNEIEHILTAMQCYASQAIDECADLVVNSVEPLGKNKILSVKTNLK
jgi:hypothetical protein